MNTSKHDITTQFLIPSLANSIRYDRGVGFFSSSWLRINSSGMIAFAGNGGRARLITSPILAEDDWDALVTGDAARTDFLLRKALEKNVSDLADALNKDILSALAWMIADEIITFKLALPFGKLDQGDFHDKFGIFTDQQGNQISFNGSPNDSLQGTRNYESIKIFCSWKPDFADLVQEDVQRFEDLWNNHDPNVRVFGLPEAAREKILRLRTGGRPYSEPEWIKLRQLREAQNTYSPKPSIPGTVILRGYQEEAISAWFDHKCKGLFEMATGTGKTITSLGASVGMVQINVTL